MKKPEEIRCQKCSANPGALCTLQAGEDLLATTLLYNPERFAHNVRINDARKAK